MPLPNTAFLDAISRWRNDVPLKNLWVLNLDTPRLRGVQANVKALMLACENQLNREAWPVIDFTSQIRPDLGYVFCTMVNLIGDAVDSPAVEIEDRGGLRPGFVLGNRTPYSGISIEMLESNLDIIDFLLRPWVIANSHFGLIKDSRFDLCCDLEIQLYTRVDRVKQNLKPEEFGTEWQLRKIFTFLDCYPTSVEPDKLNYTGVTTTDVTKTSTWYFRDYYISSPDYGDDTFTYNQQLPQITIPLAPQPQAPQTTIPLQGFPRNIGTATPVFPRGRLAPGFTPPVRQPETFGGLTPQQETRLNDIFTPPIIP